MALYITETRETNSLVAPDNFSESSSTILEAILRDGIGRESERKVQSERFSPGNNYIRSFSWLAMMVERRKKRFF